MVSALLQFSSLAAGQSAARCGMRGRPLLGASNGARALAKAGNWLPGSPTPAWLPDNMIGNFGYDPLGLGKEPSNLTRFQEGELMNGRWAMMAVAGMLTVEALGYGNWFDAPKWALTEGTPATYLGNPIPIDLKTLAVIELFLMGGAEAKRNEETDPEKRCYPGGAFDPFGLSKDPTKLEELKLKEIKNGRLAMFASVGFFCQYAATGTGPVQNLIDHIEDPFNVNFATNGVSLPF
eukprot:evm.model.scf_107.3 EVM.evm.TU.scf_107.3   scf_107:32325-34460(+)